MKNKKCLECKKEFGSKHSYFGWEVQQCDVFDFCWDCMEELEINQAKELGWDFE